MPEFEASSFAGSGFEVSSQPQGLGSKLPNSASSRVWVRGLLSLSVSVTILDHFFFPRFLSIPNEASSRNG